jgi:ABC-type transport system substrate-binding protein/DNA-binding SARP family transcriptional activator
MEIRLLGLVEASHDGHDVPLGGVKPRALLAMLALHANAPMSADRLMDGLWGESPPATAHKLVQVLVSQLRKQLAGTGAEIVTRGRGYELRVDPDAVDALHFERLLASGGNGSHSLEALALWRGPPLDDLADEPFAASEIRRLTDLWLEARETAIDAALGDGHPDAVLGELDELVRQYPLRERLHGRRLLALYRCGRQAEALEAYRDVRRVLLDEVGLEPGPELRHLNDAMLRQDPDLDGRPPRALPARTRRRSPALIGAGAAVAIAAVLVLVVTQLVGSGGLGGIAEDATGVIDPGSGDVIAQYDVGHVPDALAADDDGSVWIANGSDGTVSRVEHGQVTTIDVGGAPTALAVGAGSLWVADGQNRRVEQVDPARNRVVRRLPAGNGPRGVALAGGALWVTSALDGQVERLDLADGGAIRRIDVPGGPAAITAGGGAVWVAGEEDGVVTELDPRSGAALRAIGVGNEPVGIVVGYGGVWVANRADGTITRIDAVSGAVTDTVRVGGSPGSVAAGLGAIWVADGATGVVLRMDPRTRTVGRRIPIGSAPSALTVAGGSVWAATTAGPAGHRGGTLRFASAPFGFCSCIDPAAYDRTATPVLSLAYDGLVAYRRIPGAGGMTLVADLAESVPPPSDGGRSYTFRLRRGLRFSDGTPVHPEDFRASIERVERLMGRDAPFYDGIVGARACGPLRCDLSRGIQTDARTRRITIHLERADTEFPQKLAMPLAYVLPARAPDTLIRQPPQPGTGPYRITAFSATSGVRLVRNPRFRSRFPQARPDGFPDAIDVSFTPDPASDVAAVRQGRADAVIAAGEHSVDVPLDVSRALALTDARHVRSTPAPTTNWLFLNVRERPFDDARARRAFSYAIDRRRMVALAGGGGLASLTCQVIPPGLPGYTPTCPYTLGAAAGGGWTAPDLTRARRLVAASGTRRARVRVWGFPSYAAVTRYAGEVLRRMGYRVRVRVFADPDRYFASLTGSGRGPQVGLNYWEADFATPSKFFLPFNCGLLRRDPHDTVNPGQFCDHAVDAGYDAALAAQGTDANARWAALDRRVLAAAPVIPLFNDRTVMLLSDRVGDAPTHELLGPLLDQFWLR